MYIDMLVLSLLHSYGLTRANIVTCKNFLAFHDSTNSARMFISPLALVGVRKVNRWVIIKKKASQF